jgi:hypothetical protein
MLIKIQDVPDDWSLNVCIRSRKYLVVKVVKQVSINVLLNLIIIIETVVKILELETL